ncbi:MAG: radical SAM protein [Asgard group archaeon]
MKILLLNPPFLPRYSRSSRSPATTKGGTFYYPYFLAYCCGVLEKKGFNVKLIDAVAKKWSHEQTVEFAKSFKPDLVVIDTSTPSIYNDVEIGEKIKDALPNTHITLVGTHPTALSEETLALSPKIDSVCRGEYDYTVDDLASTIEEEKGLKIVDGLSFREGRKIIHNNPRKLIENLDELPFASEVYKKHLNIKNYFYASVRYPQVTILTARGCPHSCSFCNIPFKASYRARSPESVVDEFEYIQNELPEVKEVMIEDDTFSISKDRTIKICNLLMERKIKLKWSCNARVNTDFETLKKMKEAGCRLLCVGFETPEQEILNTIHKKTTKPLQLNFMKDTNKAGLLVNGCFVLGLPGDTEETIRRTVEFAKQLNPDTAQFYPIMVYPHTEAYEWAKKNNYLTTDDFSKWMTKEGLHTTTVSRPELSAERLVELCDKARKGFYLRPSYIFSKLKQMITHPKETKRIIMGAKNLSKYIFRGSFPGEM